MELKSIDELKDVFEKYDGKEEVIIFKFSPVCPISRRIENEFDDWFSKHKREVKLYKVNVIAARTVSNFIADEFSITHESPQLLWFDKELKVKSHTSHYNIDETFLNNNL